MTRHRSLAAWAVLALVAGLLSAGATSADAAYAVSPPTGLTSTRVANTTIQLKWNKPAGSVDSYTIQYSRSSSMSSPKYRVPTGGVTETQIGDLDPQTKYYFRIRARNNGKDVSDWSGKISRTTTKYAFGAPSTPSASRIRKDSFKISWSEVPNASRYRIQVKGTNVAPGTSDPNTAYFLTAARENEAYIGRGGTVTDEADGSDSDVLSPSRTYQVRVRALEAKTDSSGDPYDLTDYSGTRSVTTHATRSVYPVADFRVDSVVKDAITLSWQPTEDQPNSNGEAQYTADEYRVQIKSGSTTKTVDSNDGSSAQTFSKSSGRAVMTIKGFCNGTSCASFSPGSKYQFRVSSFKNNQEIGEFTAWTGDVTATSEPVSVPQDLRVDQRTDRSITVSWVAAPGATSYRLQVKKGSTSGTTRYVYDVCKTDGADPKAPCTLTGDGRVSFTMNKFEDNLDGAQTSIKGNETYYIRSAAQRSPELSAGYEDRASEYQSSYLKVTTNGWPLDPPENLVAIASTGDSVTMQWDTPEGVGARTPAGIKYRFQIAKNSDMSGSKMYPVTGTITKAPGQKAEYTVGGLNEETTYYFRLRAVDTNNSATYSDYTAEGKPATGRTTSPRGSITGTLTVDNGAVSGSTSECSPADYRLAAYWGDEPSQRLAPTSSTSTTANFRIDQLRLGGYYLRYEYVGSNSCVSPWVSSTSDPLAESHKLRPATKYTVTENGTRSTPQTSAFKGVRAAGSLTVNGTGNAAYALIAATGAAADPANGYRETHAIDATTSNGEWELRGLWPNSKYRFDFSYNDSKMSIWRNQVTDASLGNGNWTVNVCTVSSCTPSSSVPTEGGTDPGGDPPGDGYDFVIPSNLHSTAQAKNSLTLAWNAVAGAPHYRVQYSKNATMSGAGYADVSGSQTSLTLTGLSASTRYYYRVAVVEAGNGGKLSDYTQSPYPSTFTSASGSDGSDDGYAFTIPSSLRSAASGSTSLNVAWDQVADAPEYRVQYSRNANMSGASYASTTDTSLTLSGLAAGATYYYRVAVVEAGNGGKLSDYTQKPYPSQKVANGMFTSGFGYAIPGNLRSTGRTASSLTLAWDAVAGAPHYRVQYSRNANMSGASYADTTGTSLSLPGLVGGTTYYFRVAVVEAGNGGKLSDYTQQSYPRAATN